MRRLIVNLVQHRLVGHAADGEALASSSHMPGRALRRVERASLAIS